MSAFDTNRAMIQTGHIGFVSRFFTTLAVWNDARTTRNELAKLSDRELDDIGLTRGDIDRVAARR
ncbi:DUF1127 domain-containing protein [Phaeovulum sp.]|uniref:DUF1127 domain-containing protein n=1 Tax=Phaeovulum sp. TaxID=2934796 RepID=UPI003561CE70